MHRTARHLLACLLALLTFAAPAMAREEIRSFVAEITLAPDGSVEVTETIEVNAEGDEIRRGIFRDIPTTLRNEDGSLLRSSLDVISVTRDGEVEPFAMEGLPNNYRRIRIGDPDVFLARGVHRYQIRYTMTRMARRGAEHDELYWNATGNYWNFPILRARADIVLPDGAEIGGMAAYVGEPGSTEQSVTIRQTAPNRASFSAQRVLSPGEGLTLVAAFQKGVLTEPDAAQQALYWLSDHRDLILPAIAIFLVLLYYFFAWDAVGRDPQKGTIIPRFHPPKGFSPALVHYVHERGWKQNGWTAFTAAIFDLGVKGLVHIENAGKTLSVFPTGQEPEHKLPPGEAVLFDYLQAGRLTIGKETGRQIEKKRAEFISTLEAENRQVYFRNNYLYAAMGFLLSLLCLGALVLSGVLDPFWLIIAVAAGVALGLLSQAFSAIWSGAGFSRFIVAVWIVIAGANLLGGFSVMLGALRIDMPVMAAVSIVIVNVVFAVLLRAPTVQGRKVMDEIEGFLMYLETAEKNRLNFADEPPMTVKRFEAILPYAIALGVEKPWSHYFESELARHAVADAEDGSYSPNWHSGRSFSSGRISNTISSVASGMSAAMIAAQPVSSSSSGSSGGGSSGGGGGGGGGGGW